jgi:hypothetical protein
VLALYIRIFPNTWLRKWSFYLGVLVALLMISSFAFTIFQCTPVRFFWDKSISGRCVNPNQSYVATLVMSSIVAAFIFVLFLLPVPAVWGLHLTRTRKYGLAFVFSIGALFVRPSGSGKEEC